MDRIIFGIDGRRGVIGGDFTFANVRCVAAALAEYVREESEPARGLMVGYDTRFLSTDLGRAVAEVLSTPGIRVWPACAPTPAPAMSYAVMVRQTAGAVTITASHNPYRWNGVKFKAAYGGSAAPAIMYRNQIHFGRMAHRRAHPRRAEPASAETDDLTMPYLEWLRSRVRLDRIHSSTQRLVINPMYGAARGCIARLFAETGIGCQGMHSEQNPPFPGLSLELLEPLVAELRHAVIDGGYDAGSATDSDADRVGAVYEVELTAAS